MEFYGSFHGSSVFHGIGECFHSSGIVEASMGVVEVLEASTEVSMETWKLPLRPCKLLLHGNFHFFHGSTTPPWIAVEASMEVAEGPIEQPPPRGSKASIGLPWDLSQKYWKLPLKWLPCKRRKFAREWKLHDSESLRVRVSCDASIESLH